MGYLVNYITLKATNFNTMSANFEDTMSQPVSNRGDEGVNYAPMRLGKGRNLTMDEKAFLVEEMVRRGVLRESNIKCTLESIQERFYFKFSYVIGIRTIQYNWKKWWLNRSTENTINKCSGQKMTIRTDAN